ncbi:MAG: hypothetical protein N4A65_04130 [Cohaesibacter sp.]|nr:hypothetical protein [Cohaesibacter sp.]
MIISGGFGFSKADLELDIWPKDGFHSLESHINSLGKKVVATKTDEQLSYRFWDYAPEPVAGYAPGIIIKGEGFQYDAGNNLVAGVITEITIVKMGSFSFPGASVQISDIAWDVADINAKRAEFWNDIFDGNDQVTISQSVFSANLTLGDGDDAVTLEDMMPRHGGRSTIDLGAGDDFIYIDPEVTSWGDLKPASLTLGAGFDDIVMDAGPWNSNFIKDFNPNEDRIQFLNLPKDAKIVDVEGGIQIGRAYIAGVSADQVKLENGFLMGTNGRDYSRHVNDAAVTQYLHGTTNNDVFVVGGKQSDYKWHATDDGRGVVIWKVGEEIPDLLYNFEKLRFSDVTLNLSDWPTDAGMRAGYNDLAMQTQYLDPPVWGQTFVISGKREAYDWGPTEDGTGIVVWNKATGIHDILTNFAWIQFADEKVDLVQLPSSLSPVVEDVPGETQYLTAEQPDTVFVIEGFKADYGWGPTEDGTGTVVWNDNGHDILTDFSAIRFFDGQIDLAKFPTSWGQAPGGDKLIEDKPLENEYLEGESGEEIFVIDGNKDDFGFGPTQDGKGVVIWDHDSFDILMNFKAIRFADAEIAVADILNPEQPVSYAYDVAGATQMLEGGDGHDVFVVDDVAGNYAWGPTEDGNGIVVWNHKDDSFDLLFGFEELAFNDHSFQLEEPA